MKAKMNCGRDSRRASNAKLLRLHRIASDVKTRFGGKEKLIDALLVLVNRAKDGDYRDKLLSYPGSSLLSMHGTAERKQKAKSKAA